MTHNSPCYVSKLDKLLKFMQTHCSRSRKQPHYSRTGPMRNLSPLCEFLVHSDGLHFIYLLFMLHQSSQFKASPGQPPISITYVHVNAGKRHRDQVWINVVVTAERCPGRPTGPLHHVQVNHISLKSPLWSRITNTGCPPKWDHCIPLHLTTSSCYTAVSQILIREITSANA